MRATPQPGQNSTCPNCGEKVPYAKFWWNNTTGNLPCPHCKTCIQASARQMWLTFLVLVLIVPAVVLTGNPWAILVFFILGNMVLGLYRARYSRFVISRSQDCNN